jgi:peptide/nickel transport system substrate-binding protein
MKFPVTRFLGAAVSCLGIALLAPPPAAAQPADTLVVAQASDVLTLDASADTSPISLNVFKNIYDQLIDIAADGSVQPLLATAWEASRDSTIWTFSLRAGAKFHDGTPVTADDVVWTYRMIMGQAKSPVRSYLVKVKSVEQTADGRIRFVLTESFAPFDRQVSLISIMPQKAYEKMGAAKFAGNPVGSGPFKVVRWVKDDRVELEAFAGYWGGAPKIRKVVFRPVPSETARAAALLSGELDVVPVLPPSLVERLSARKGVRIEKVASNKVLYLGFNV